MKCLAREPGQDDVCEVPVTLHPQVACMGYDHMQIQYKYYEFEVT
jgi:hypothetical protein